MAANGGEQAAAAADPQPTRPPPRVLSIQSHVVSGYVGNKVMFLHTGTQAGTPIMPTVDASHAAASSCLPAVRRAAAAAAGF